MKFLKNLILFIFCACATTAGAIGIDKSAVLAEFNITDTKANRQVLDDIIADIDSGDKLMFDTILSERPQNAYMILQELERKNAPEFLLYLAMTESHLTNSATSKAKAVGMWQFMPVTAKHFGLKITNEIDERRDPFRSTEAAYKYLKFMNNNFGKWYLSVMSYNSGDGAIRRIIKNSSDDFSALLANPRLAKETRAFIKQIIKLSVLAKINKTKEKLYEEAPAYHLEEVEVKGGTSLDEVGFAIGVSLKNMKKYNAHIKTNFAPKNLETYHFYIPAEKLGMFVINYVQEDTKTLFRTHAVSKDDTLDSIAEKWGVEKSKIIAKNNIKNDIITPNQRLKIPFDGNLATLDIKKYKVKHGDTLHQISSKFDVKVQDIAIANNIVDNKIKPGDIIVIP